VNHKWLAEFKYALIGNGRAGNAFAAALAAAGREVVGPLGRDEYHLIGDCDVVLICVPDREIANVAARITPGPIVGHCSGAIPLTVLEPHQRFGLHPLVAIPRNETLPFAGVGCAIAGSSDRAVELARYMAGLLKMEPFTIDDRDRRAYHTAACIAGNLPIAIWEVASQLAESKGVDSRYLVPLIQSVLDNWANDGARALTGPIARGDNEVVEAQRHVIADEQPEFLPLFDELVGLTRHLFHTEVASEVSSND
jgi:predicted short-subunit dehydrogenase-like oxidoreductase (DUF2520 family)